MLTQARKSRKQTGRNVEAGRLRRYKEKLPSRAGSTHIKCTRRQREIHTPVFIQITPQGQKIWEEHRGLHHLKVFGSTRDGCPTKLSTLWERGDTNMDNSGSS